MSLVPGQPAPPFALPRDGGGTVRLADLRGRLAVLFFYPGDATPSCTTEARDFSALLPRFAAAGAAVLGVSSGTAAAKARFVRKAGVAVPLLADEDGGMLRAFGVWQEKRTFGKAYLGIARTTVLLDPEGRVLRVWPVARVKGHAEEVLAELEAQTTPA